MTQKRYPQKVANWWLSECLGSGYSGAIFKAQNVHTGQVVALKLQDINHECPTNRYERGFYPTLQGGVGMPTLWASGVEGRYDYLAIDLLGASLDSLYRKSGKNMMDLRSVCCIAIQVIKRLEFMHGRGILHRDIQLGNCTIGLGPRHETIYMIDFGFSKRYIDAHTGRHIPDSKAKRDFIGNYWFSSVGVHCRGRVPSRRDDLEAVALMLIHLLTPGGLPWTRNGVPKTDIAHERLKREKKNTCPNDLCRGLPPEFEEFLRYCRRLKFEECPDYQFWIAEFRSVLLEHGFPDSDAFVWPPPPAQTSVHVSRHARPSLGQAASDCEQVLRDLARLDLRDRQVLGTRNTNEGPVNLQQIVQKKQQKPAPLKRQATNPEDEVIQISSDDENEPTKAPAVLRLPKATHLVKLTKSLPEASTNLALSKVVREFIEVLQSNRSRTLTKEAFGFLEALNRQLADPDVFLVPMRTSRSKGSPAEEPNREVDARRAKMNKLYSLQTDVCKAPSNAVLAQLVSDFGAVIDKSSGRTLTKDAFGFLESLAARLRVLQ